MSTARFIKGQTDHYVAPINTRCLSETNQAPIVIYGSRQEITQISRTLNLRDIKMMSRDNGTLIGLAYIAVSDPKVIATSRVVVFLKKWGSTEVRFFNKLREHCPNSSILFITKFDARKNRDFIKQVSTAGASWLSEAEMANSSLVHKTLMQPWETRVKLSPQGHCQKEWFAAPYRDTNQPLPFPTLPNFVGFEGAFVRAVPLKSQAVPAYRRIATRLYLFIQRLNSEGIRQALLPARA